MKIKENWVDNKGIKIHYIDNELKDTNKTPLLICPGLSESCEDYINIIDALNDRRCVALSFRGRGKSDSPDKGYTLKDHVDDISSVVNELRLNNFCIMGYSRGVSYALGYSILNPNLLKGIIIGEYPAEHKKMPNGWAKESIKFYNTHCESISITYEALKSIEKESDQVYFKEELNKINCPFLLLKGEQEETLLSRKDILNYIEYLNSRSIRIESFDKAGHDIKCDDFIGLMKVINEFLESID
ncbi:alpha/beta fold hydrolase [Faecalimicrobium sp. JNUCC 81]